MSKMHKHNRGGHARASAAPDGDASRHAHRPHDDLSFSNITISRHPRFSMADVTGVAIGAFMLGAFAMMVLSTIRPQKPGTSHGD
ncbi:MAG: hypothetical protein RL186_1687 [Pseudomonadota bacterium]|jgi:hypothetical protein